MLTQIKLLLGGMLLCAMATPATPSWAAAAPTPGACQDGVLPSGALSRICVPATGWNGDLLVWAFAFHR